jgi:NADH dehydrogenase
MSVPAVEGLWAVGDCAAVINAYDAKVCPPTAQFAEAQAKQLAVNIVARLNGQSTRAFRYRSKGQLSSVGHNKAVAEVLGLKLSGFVAWLLWRGVYLLRMPTLARRTRLFLEWNWAMFFPPDVAHLGFRRTPGRSASPFAASSARGDTAPGLGCASLPRWPCEQSAEHCTEPTTPGHSREHR